MQDIISENSFLSIVIPTYNESENILKLIDAIIHHIPSDISSEIIIVDNDSPDRTGILIEEYIKNITNETYNNTAKRSNHKNNCKKNVQSKLFIGI